MLLSGSVWIFHLLHIRQGLKPVRVPVHALGVELVSVAEVWRSVNQRHVNPGVIHLRYQVICKEGYIRNQRRHILLDVVLAVDPPFEAVQTTSAESLPP